jgi:putative sugar O-methyltransferase
MSRHAQLLAFVQQEIARRDALPAGVLAPSDYWKDANGYSSYVRTLPDEELKHIRRHTWHLTGDRYDTYQFISERQRRRIIAQYESTLPQLGGFRPHEPDGGIGVDTPYGRLNSGILRYSVVLGDLIGAGLLSRENAPRVLEIGGGYGGLALLCLQFNPRISYVLCDLEESLFIQGVFLSQQLGEGRVKLGLPASPEPGTVHLVPQTRAGELAGLRFDFAVNQQSMQEMTLAQVEHYCDLLSKCAAKFYSCNRSSHGAGVVRDKGIVADLHGALARRFEILWDSTDHVPALARACLRHKALRKLVTAFIGKSFLPAGEAALRRFVYRCQA